MAKKIYDILPPKEKIEEKKIKPLAQDFRIKKERKKEDVPKSPILKIFSIFILLIVVAGGFLYFYLAKAKIEIWLETKTLNLNTKITVDKGVKQIDTSAKNIPGIVFETNEIVATQEFSSSGEVKKKSTGIIRVYNNYSSSPTTFRANTRFMSDSGLVFQSEEKIVVPGKPGYIDVKVIAAEAGENYNIGPATFSIPGLAGTPLYTYFYGKSFFSMTGGGTSAKVVQEDLDRAKEILTERALNDCQSALKNKITQEFILLKDASECEVIETFSPVKVGAELKNFIYTVKAKGKILSFRAQDIKKFAEDFILSQSPENSAIDEASFKMNYSTESIDLNIGKIVLSLQLEGKIYSNIDQNIIKESLKNKSSKESEFLLGNQPQIKKASVKFWPFWVNKIPDNLRKIEIKLNLD